LHAKSLDSPPNGSHTLPLALPLALPPIALPLVAQPVTRQWPGAVDTVDTGELSPEAECPYLVIVRPHAGHVGGIHTPTMKQPTSMWLFPHQQAEKSLQNQHVLSILIVGLNQLKHRLSRTNTPKSHPSSNT